MKFYNVSLLTLLFMAIMTGTFLFFITNIESNDGKLQIAGEEWLMQNSSRVLSQWDGAVMLGENLKTLSTERLEQSAMNYEVIFEDSMLTVKEGVFYITNVFIDEVDRVAYFSVEELNNK